MIRQYPDMKLTVRKIFYRLVATGKMKNELSSYKRRFRVLRDARLDGQVSFTDIEDRARKIIRGDYLESKGIKKAKPLIPNLHYKGEPRFFSSNHLRKLKKNV
ncbi:MAG: hypothetical protein GKC03_06770 [Methanomassiliicoccales archaeon]|nr:hypothetical protein [Methanomassiliicoccales archaeon]NYT14766.1 hypothetical protein [Methanomassiliicoccales archaeon]